MADLPFPLLPSVADLCVEMPRSPGLLCVNLPGGATICAQTGYDLGDLTGIAQAMIAQINTALAPLQPFFNVLDILDAIFKCVQAIPDCLGPPPNPKEIIDCIPNLAKKIAALLQLLPPLCIPPLIRSIIEILITALQGIENDIKAQLAALDRILESATAAAALGNVELQNAVDCAQNQLDAEFANKNASMAPLNRLIGVINFFMSLAGLGCIPQLGGLEELAQPLLDVIDDIIALLEKILSFIPDLSFGDAGITDCPNPGAPPPGPPPNTSH
jgi:hypothetical protein